MGAGTQPLTREYPASATVTDTVIPYREHDISSHAKKVTVIGSIPGADPANNSRSLKPTAATIGAGGDGGFDLDSDSTYRYIATGDTNVLLAGVTGIVPDADDLFVPAGMQLLIHTGSQWSRLEVFSTPGAAAQVVKVG